MAQMDEIVESVHLAELVILNEIVEFVEVGVFKGLNGLNWLKGSDR